MPPPGQNASGPVHDCQGGLDLLSPVFMLVNFFPDEYGNTQCAAHSVLVAFSGSH